MVSQVKQIRCEELASGLILNLQTYASRVYIAHTLGLNLFFRLLMVPKLLNDYYPVLAEIIHKKYSKTEKPFMTQIFNL